MSELILAAVAPGNYYIIDGTEVVGTVTRKWSRDYTEYPEYEYEVEMNGEKLYYTTLPAIHRDFEFHNYPGYGAVLRQPADKKVYKDRYKKHRYRR